MKRSLTGKIAALPYTIREQLNRRLLDGQKGPRILPWLNSLPAVKTILAEQYHAKPINHQNLSYWRADGYQRWYEENRPFLQLQQHARSAKKYARAARHLAAGADAIVADRLFQQVQDPNLPTEDLLKLHPAIKAIRKADQQDSRLKLDKYKVRQKDAQILLQRDIHHRDVVAIGHRLVKDEIAKYVVASDCTNEEKIEILGRHMFGEFWQPRFIPKDTVVPLPASLAGQPKGGPAADGAFKRPQASASDSTDKNEGAQPPQEPHDSLANSQKTPPETPSNIVPFPATPESNQGEPAADPSFVDVTESPNEGTTRPTASPSPGGEGRGEGGLKFTIQDNEPDTSDIPCPQITPGKTTQQLIAEIEDYAIQVSAARKARRKLSSSPPQAPTENPAGVQSFSPGLEQPGAPEYNEGGSDYLGSQPQPDQGSMPEASRAASPRAHLHLPPKSQQPLSPYDKALLEGKSHLEALYAQFTPTPEEFARRKRANEELRRASEPLAAPELATAGEGGSPVNNLQYYGPCPAPYSWQGHRPLDPWKVHTS